MTPDAPDFSRVSAGSESSQDESHTPTFACCCAHGIDDDSHVVSIVAACCPLHGSLRVAVDPGLRVARKIGSPDGL
jgi:hypothetical protein